MSGALKRTATPLVVDIPEAALTASPRTLPMQVVHRLAKTEVGRLSDSWTALRDVVAAELMATTDGNRRRQLQTFDRLGRAAQRLVELWQAERRAHSCPACGFDGLDKPPYLAFEGLPEDQVPRPPYAVHFGDPSGERCPSCGYGFGIDDHPVDGREPVSFEDWRRDWYARGCPWFAPDAKRSIWAAEQG